MIGGTEVQASALCKQYWSVCFEELCVEAAEPWRTELKV